MGRRVLGPQWFGQLRWLRCVCVSPFNSYSQKTIRYAVTLVAVLGLGTTALGHPRAGGSERTPEPVGQRCVVLLHGKGGEGDSTEIDEQGVATIRPTGNAEAWDGWEWRYFPDESFDEALTIVNEAAAAATP